MHAKRLGLSGAAITDHDSTKCWKGAGEEAKRQGMIFIPSMEVSSAEGHIIGLGLTQGIRSGLSAEETADSIRGQGGVAIAAHPFDVRGFGIGRKIILMDAVEVFNAMSLDRVSNRFAESMAEKAGKPKLAGSDAHSLEMLGLAANLISAQDAESVLRMIRKGRLAFERRYIPMDVVMEWIRERLIRSYGDVAGHINSNYSPPKAWLAKNMLRRFVLSRSPFWDMLGGFGIGMSRLYSSIKLLRYW